MCPGRRILSVVCWNLIDMDQAELASIAGDMGVAEPSDAFADLLEAVPAP
jgi:hypothetical protein